MRFAYTEVGPDFYRPMVAVWIWGPVRSFIADGLVDTAADCTLLTPPVAHTIGIDPGALTESTIVETAAIDQVPCKVTTVTLGLFRDAVRLFWMARVAVPIVPMNRCLWGYRGFLEYFQASFYGPDLYFDLIAAKSIPVVSPPTQRRS
jgi:hypothetical protein